LIAGLADVSIFCGSVRCDVLYKDDVCPASTGFVSSAKVLVAERYGVDPYPLIFATSMKVPLWYFMDAVL
jgi:hypothetical protein